jgi:mannan endo-1,4-beta-mannosidase
MSVLAPGGTHRARIFVFASVLLGSGSAVAAGPGDFVTTNGTKFQLGGQDFYFQGTNFYRIGILEQHTEAQVYEAFSRLAAEGIRVVRFWGFACSGSTWGTPLLVSADEHRRIYNEDAFRRIDTALDAARAAGVKVIVPMVNFEPEYCGMQWWTEQVIGNSDKHQFYVDERVKRSYKAHVETFLNRENSIARERRSERLLYKDDPTIMAIEVANEPHTRDNYEIERGLRPGQLVYDWLAEITAHVRAIDGNHLISTGEEGYKTTHNSCQQRCDWHQWIHNGSKGVDFARNLTLPHVDFATVHIYPDNWQIPAQHIDWVRDHLVADRARIAHAQNKPIVLEESGFSTAPQFSAMGYQGDRARWLAHMYDFANQAGYAGTMVWQSVPPGFESGTYTFDFNSDMFTVVRNQAAHMNALSGRPSRQSCARGTDSDPDRDNWGWEQSRSCSVP